jgi:hypothetical protein
VESCEVAVNVPDNEVALEGVHVTVTTHELPAARVPLQVSDSDTPDGGVMVRDDVLWLPVLLKVKL